MERSNSQIFAVVMVHKFVEKRFRKNLDGNGLLLNCGLIVDCNGHQTRLIEAEGLCFEFAVVTCGVRLWLVQNGHDCRWNVEFATKVID